MGRKLTKGKRKQVNDKLCDKRPKLMHKYINNLPDELLVVILSRMPLKEAARTSVLSHRWRYLWQFISGTLDFDYTANGTPMEQEKFIAWVNRILRLHQGSRLDSMIISFRHEKKGTQSQDIDSWIDFAIQKKVTRFELKLSDGFYPNSESNYVFPDLNKLLSRSRESGCVFFSLKALRLVNVNIKDEVVHYLLALCPFLEQLCLNGSLCTKNLKVLDPLPSLKHLEIANCNEIQSLDISVSTPVSIRYSGAAISVPFKKVPNLSELTLAGTYCEDFIFESNKHCDYSVGLEKLVLELPFWRSARIIRVPPDFPRLCSLKQLELKIVRNHGQRLLFFLSLIKSCPLLRRFRIKMGHIQNFWKDSLAYPEVKAVDTTGFYLNHLKVVEMAGYIGGSYGAIELLLHLVKIAPSLELIVMEPRQIPGLFYPIDKMMESARKRINCLRRKLPSQIRLIEL